MQVAEHTDLIKQAVIGGGKTLDFGISSNAEFFHILSSTLYTDQILAVVREVICNAWDAHIAAGITNTPIQISTEGNKFTVKDFGKGIADADIKPIYCIYGASTKTQDGSQTGGFGLGCKAPFAYTEHFQVISCNNGTKTIYTMTKASTETGGKPGVTTIASFPTDETGITVSVNLEDEDVSHFNNKIRTIVRNGGIKAIFNGELLSTFDFTGSKDELYFAKSRSGINAERVLLSYGNIIYLIPIHEEYQVILKSLSSFLRQINNKTGYGLTYNLIIKAPPNSITVTPSRESLSLQEKTVTNLTLLLENALTILNREFPFELISLLKQKVDDAAITGKAKVLTTNNPFNSFADAHLLKDGEYKTVKSLAHLAKEYLDHAGTEAIHYEKSVANFFYEYQVKAATKIGLVDRGLANTYLKELKTDPSNSKWAVKRVISKLYNKIINTEGLHTYDLWVYDENKHSYNSRARHIHSPLSWKQYFVYHQYDLITKTIVFGSSIQLAKKQLDDVDPSMGKLFLFYKAPVGTKKQAEALAKLKALGCNVIDVIPKKEPTVRIKSDKPKVVKLAGYHPFSNILNFNADSTDRITDFKFVFNLAANCREEQNGYISKFSKHHSKYIVNLIGKDGAITLRSNTYEKLLATGKVSYEAYLLDIISETILNSENIKKQVSMDFPSVISIRSLSIFAREIATAINASLELRSIFKIEEINLTNDEIMALEIYNRAKSCSAFRNHMDKLGRIANHLKNIPLAPTAKGLVDFIEAKDSKFVTPERFHKVVSQLQSPEPKERQRAVMFVLSMLNT